MKLERMVQRQDFCGSHRSGEDNIWEEAEWVPGVSRCPVHEAMADLHPWFTV